MIILEKTTFFHQIGSKNRFLLQVVFRKQSSVKCEPNTNGKQTVEELVIEVKKIVIVIVSVLKSLS